MGGTAFIIWGDLDARRLEPVPAKKSFIDRITGRQRFLQPEVVLDWPDRHVIDIPAQELNELTRDFQRYLADRIPRPQDPDKFFCRYLKDGVMSLYVRGERSSSQAEAEWYVQLTFSGCAGTAEVSAELARHWAKIWYSENQDRLIGEYFAPFGFMPREEQEDKFPPTKFIPVGRLGYAMYVGHSPVEADPGWQGPRLFEMDAAIMDALEIRGEISPLGFLDELLGPIMADNRCRCRLCMPEFDPYAILKYSRDSRAAKLAALK